MAVQTHFAHSSIMRGVGVIAGVAYDCTNSAVGVALSARLYERKLFFAAAFSEAEKWTVAVAVRRALSTIRQLIFLAKKYGCFPDQRRPRAARGEETRGQVLQALCQPG